MNQRPSVRFASPTEPRTGLGSGLGSGSGSGSGRGQGRGLGPHGEEEEMDDGGMRRDGQDRAVINHAAATLQVSE